VLAAATVVAPALAVASPAAAGSHPTGPGAGCANRTNDSVRKVLECVTVDGVRQHQAAFQDIADANGGTRSSGTPGYDASVDYAAGVLQGAGYEVTVQPFEFEFSVDFSSITLPGGEEIGALSNQFTPRTSGEASGPLTPVDVILPPSELPSSTSGCEEADFEGFEPGAVALIKRGTCGFAQKALNAQAAGASAVILFNEGQPGRTGLIIPIGDAPGLSIPVVAVDFATGEMLNTLAGQTVTVNAELVIEQRTAENVIAESPQGDDANVVMAGAHLDSVIDGPGLNDNGSGSATILEVAEALRKAHPTNTIRFALWGAEEFGLLGSEFYVDQLSDDEIASIAVYLNFDMVGSPNFIRGIYDGSGEAFPNDAAAPPGSAAIETVFEQFYDERGLAHQEVEFSGRSDYGPFIAVGVPSGGLFTGAEGIKTETEAGIYGGTAGEQYDPCYHSACDTYDNVSVEVLDQNADAVAYATFTFSKDLSAVDAQAGGAARVAASSSQAGSFNNNLAGEPAES